jgi:gamma-glutamyltranspeptidase/glutathione hydrolase
MTLGKTIVFTLSVLAGLAGCGGSDTPFSASSSGGGTPVPDDGAKQPDAPVVRTVKFDPSLCVAQAGAPYGQTVGISGTNLMVTSADVNASAAGCKVLAKGGSAIDAAIAVQAVLGVAEPFASGLGGGSVITYYDAASNKVRTFDGLSASPSNIGGATNLYQVAVSEDTFCRSAATTIGVSSLSAQQGNTNISGRAVGVPGTLKVLDLVHRAYGKTAWNQLWDDAIGLARDGFPMTKYMYSTLYNDGTDFDDETGDPLNAGGVPAWFNSARTAWGAARCKYGDIKSRYCEADVNSVKPVAVGTLIKNQDLADTMALVRDGGAAAFYDANGPIVAKILKRFRDDKFNSTASATTTVVTTANNNCYTSLPSTYNTTTFTTSAAITPARIPSLMVGSDFANYQAVERKPLVGTRFGMTIYTQPAPLFGGVVTLYSLGLLERKAVQAQTFGSPEYFHLVTEASRLANADRRNIVGDPAFSNVNARVATLLSNAYLDERAALITGTALGSVPVGTTGIAAFAATSPGGYDTMAKLSVPAAAKAGKAGKAPTLLARAGKPGVHDEDWNTTSNVAIIDGYGNALSMTTTINTHWGAHIEAAGIMLNDALSNFSTGAAPAGGDVNGFAASKRPRSSISPAIAFDAQGRLRLVWGSAGGGPIPDYIVKTFLGNVVYNMDIQAAINADNFTGQNGIAEIESGSPSAALIPGLRTTYGYTSSTLAATGLTSGLSGIAVGYDAKGWPVYRAGADYRRNGGGNGY